MARTEPHSRPTERGSTGTPWLAAGFGLVVLIVAGFGVGMVAGVAWEDPGLIFAYLTGETEEVAWSDSQEVASDFLAEARTRTAQPGPERAVDPQLRREAANAPAAPPPKAPPSEAPAPSAPAPVAAPPTGSVAVQVGAFESSEAAERLASSLRSKGFPVYVSPGTKSGSARWRVRVGPLATRSEAEATATRLKKSEKLPTWILNEDAS
jgi:cell division septation protein DedD